MQPSLFLAALFPISELKSSSSGPLFSQPSPCWDQSYKHTNNLLLAFNFLSNYNWYQINAFSSQVVLLSIMILFFLVFGISILVSSNSVGLKSDIAVDEMEPGRLRSGHNY